MTTLVIPPLRPPIPQVLLQGACPQTLNQLLMKNLSTTENCLFSDFHFKLKLFTGYSYLFPSF